MLTYTYTHSYSVFTYILKTILQSSNHVTLALNTLFIVQQKSLLSLQACCSLTLALCITNHPLFALHLFLQSKPCYTLDQAARELWKNTMFLLLLGFFSHKPYLFSVRCCYLTQLLLVRWSFFFPFILRDCCLWSSRGKKQVRVELFCSGCQHGASVAQSSPHPTPTPLAISCEAARSPVIPVVPHPFPLLPCCITGSPQPLLCLWPPEPQHVSPPKESSQSPSCVPMCAFNIGFRSILYKVRGCWFMLW